MKHGEDTCISSQNNFLFWLRSPCGFFGSNYRITAGGPINSFALHLFHGSSQSNAVEDGGARTY